MNKRLILTVCIAVIIFSVFIIAFNYRIGHPVIPHQENLNPIQSRAAQSWAYSIIRLIIEPYVPIFERWSAIIPPEGVFERQNASLSGTHISTFVIRFVDLTINPDERLSCVAKDSSGQFFEINVTNLTLASRNYTLNYTIQANDSIINNPDAGYLPWILKNCSLTNSSGLIYMENKTSRIYMHSPNYWADDEITRAVTCEGTPGVYFNNTAKCEFSEDTMFALQMRNGNPVEPSCFNNAGIGCGNDYCRGIFFPGCDALVYFFGFNATSDDPNGYTTFSASFAGYSTDIAYTRYINASWTFKLRAVQALTGKTFSFTIYNLTHVNESMTNVYGPSAGKGRLSASQESDGTWNVAYYNFSAFTGTLDFVFNISFTSPDINQNRTLKLVIAYGTDTNQGSPDLFSAMFSTTLGLRNNNESENNSLTNENGGVCGDGVNNDFNYIGPGGIFAYSYDCFDFACNGRQGDSSQTNEFGSGKTGLCNYRNETNCTDRFDNDYDYILGTDYTDCHDFDCFRNDSAGCPSIETICNDSINNDWDYTSAGDIIGWLNNANNTKYAIFGTTDLTDCRDGDCGGKPGGLQGQICNWAYEKNCSDGFDNDALQLKDCELNTKPSSTSVPTINDAEYDCTGWCRTYDDSGHGHVAVNEEIGALCDNGKDDDYDAVVVTNPYSGMMNTSGGGIDCRWGGYFGIGSNYYPEPSCDNETLSNGKQCQLMRERNCSDSFDNDFDNNASGMPHGGWAANSNSYENYFGQAFVNYADYDDYDCRTFGDRTPSSEAINASWCFDGIDNDLDAYYFNGTGYKLNTTAGYGLPAFDCLDRSCKGISNPAAPNQTCLDYEYNASDPFFQSLFNPGSYCKNLFDDDGDAPLGWPFGGTDCTDPDCNKQFGMCDEQCYATENITWDSCMNGIDDNVDMPTAMTDCKDSNCSSMIGENSGAKCEYAAETRCDDRFDNNANSKIDCADKPSCNNRIGGIVNNTIAYCNATESTLRECYDLFDNDANGMTDCYDTGCNNACNLSTISGTSPISMPNWAGQTAINSVTDAYIADYTKKVRENEWYNITMKMTGASTNAQWTLGTAAKQFNKTAFNASTAYLSGANAGNFALSETANGFILNSNHANLPSGYTVSFMIKAMALMPSSTYELTYAEEQGSKTSLNNFIYHEIDENIAPVAQIIQPVPYSGKVDYGGAVYLRANASDNYALGACDWKVYGNGTFTPARSTQCRASFTPAAEGVYYINVTPIDYYSNIGAPITINYIVNIVPTSAYISIDKIIPFYNSSTGEKVTINATFNVATGDSLGTCNVIARNDSGNETTLASFSATGNNCYANDISISSLDDGDYRILVRVLETTDGDYAYSNSKALFACKANQKGECRFSDYNLDSKPDICPLKVLTVGLVSPAHNFVMKTANVEFECVAGGPNELVNLTLFVWNASNGLHNSVTINISGTSNSSRQIVALVPNGNYNWNCLASDVNGSAWAKINRTIIVSDIIPPLVTLISPSDSYSTTESSVAFNFNVTDVSEIGNCSLIINGEKRITESNVTRSISQSINRYMVAGNYEWSINCTDIAGNEGNSSTRKMSISAVVPPVIPPGGGGGKKPVNISEMIEKIIVIPSSLTVNVLEGREAREQITIINHLENDAHLRIEVEGLDKIVENERDFYVKAGEERNMSLIILAKERGVFAGKIIIKDKESGAVLFEIPVVINVISEKFLFDLTVSVLNPRQQVARGRDLIAKIRLLQIGAATKTIKVTATYIIKDFEGKEYIRYNETFDITGEKEFIKKFNTLALKRGKYVLGVEVAYPAAYATASAEFEVTIGYLWWIVVPVIIIIAGYLIVRIVRRRRRERSARILELTRKRG